MLLFGMRGIKNSRNWQKRRNIWNMIMKSSWCLLHEFANSLCKKGFTSAGSWNATINEKWKMKKYENEATRLSPSDTRHWSSVPNFDKFKTVQQSYKKTCRLLPIANDSRGRYISMIDCKTARCLRATEYRSQKPISLNSTCISGASSSTDFCPFLSSLPG